MEVGKFRKKGESRRKNPITNRYEFLPTSCYVMYDKKTKLWIHQRKRNYYYWFRFLQFCLKNNLDVDMSKYRGWGSQSEIINSKFDDFWKKNWVKLFGFKRHPKTRKEITKPKYKLNRKIEGVSLTSIRLSLLVVELGTKMSSLEISNRIFIEEGKKGHFRHYFDVTSYKTKDNVQQVRKNISKYRSKGNKTIKNVCSGIFP